MLINKNYRNAVAILFCSAMWAGEFGPIRSNDDPRLQKIFIWAQQAVGVPERRRLNKICDAPACENMRAYTNQRGIFICPSFYTLSTLSAQKYILAHESTHYLHNDLLTGVLRKFPALEGLMILPAGVWTLLKSSNWLYRNLSISCPARTACAYGAGALFVLWIVCPSVAFCVRKVKQYLILNNPAKERRADETALKALDCYVCALECVSLGRSEHSPYGYLSKQEMRDKAHDLMVKKRLCADHAHVKLI